MVNVIISFRPHQGLSNFLSNGECLIILQRQVSVPIRGYLISYKEVEYDKRIQNASFRPHQGLSNFLSRLCNSSIHAP